MLQNIGLFVYDLILTSFISSVFVLNINVNNLQKSLLKPLIKKSVKHTQAIISFIEFHSLTMVRYRHSEKGIPGALTGSGYMGVTMNNVTNFARAGRMTCRVQAWF